MSRKLILKTNNGFLWNLLIKDLRCKNTPDLTGVKSIFLFKEDKQYKYGKLTPANAEDSVLSQNLGLISITL